MGLWQHASPEAERRLLELAGLFAACREVFFDIGQGEFHWVPATESLATFDLANAEEGPAGRWGEAPVHQMVNVVANYLLIASSHLGALATLHARQEVLLSPPLLVRAVIENCARAVWGLPSTTRRARAYASLAPTSRSGSARRKRRRCRAGWARSHQRRMRTLRRTTATYATRCCPADSTT